VNFEIRAVTIRSKVNIFQSLEMIGVKLIRGAQTQQIVCPFHDDTKPSARVYEDTGKLFCFTCHKLWDPIQLVMEKYEVSFEQAIERIESHFHIDPNKIDLPTAIRYNVSRPQTPNLYHLAAYVEDRLIANRRSLGLKKYVKALYALDVFRYNYQKGKITSEDFRHALAEIGKFTTA
jgi:DNA primase